MAITYLLQIYLKKQKHIKIGKLGTFRFTKGNYVYVGSAKTNMTKRIARHLRKKKKKFWHIDYLLQYAEVQQVWTSDLTEEKMAALLSEKMEIPVIGFGSSDVKSKSHLFFIKKGTGYFLDQFFQKLCVAKTSRL
ncbi:GIY-YIG nuclease family protein [candidate division WOR-3 bacterium]|nr:GIY-YIG nuclease family protein [candidate division WOR-3 bacterium]